MKKLVILPLLALAGGVLASCGDKPAPKPVGPSDAKLAPASFTDSEGKEHKRTSTIENDGMYYLAYYRATSEEMRVVNGEPHKDGAKEYPFYMGTSLADSGEEVAIKVHYVDDVHFTMQFIGEGTKWHEKYVSIYKATSLYGNDVYSVNAAENVGDKFIDEDDNEIECYYNFEMMAEYDDFTLGVPVIKIADERKEESTPEPKFLGSGVDGDGEGYISIDCSNATKAMEDTYNLAFFYEI